MDLVKCYLSMRRYEWSTDTQNFDLDRVKWRRIVGEIAHMEARPDAEMHYWSLDLC